MRPGYAKQNAAAYAEVLTHLQRSATVLVTNLKVSGDDFGALMDAVFDAQDLLAQDPDPESCMLWPGLTGIASA